MQRFRLASDEEINYINSMFDAVKAKGKIDGTSDCDEDYPNKEIIAEDIKNKGLYVLEDQGKVVASISLLEDEPEEIEDLGWERVRSCFLVRLCVAPEYQGKGIGEQMMKSISIIAKEKGYKATHHLAAEANKVANRLYKRMGYKDLGLIHVYDTDFIAYEKVL
jgi:ribosomal protein S18 acetylase RimI-like enzyme